MVAKRWWGLSAIGLALALFIGGGLIDMTDLELASAVEFAPPTRSDEFDGEQAYRYLVEICKLGPRITATRGMHTQQEILRRHFEQLGGAVELQSFRGTQPSQGQKPFPCANLVVRWHPSSTRRVLLGVHYDTRPQADNEPLLRRRREPFLGANDGASGVAFLMELGRLIPNLTLNVGVDFVCFDAEEYIHASTDRFFLGSEHFAREYTTQSNRPFQYEAVIVLDMIADRDLEIHPDELSWANGRARPLIAEVWSIARELGVRSFRPEPKYEILDDHLAFQNAGLPAIVLIDFSYAHWHRLTDTPDKCSARSLASVARVIVEWLKRQR